MKTKPLPPVPFEMFVLYDPYVHDTAISPNPVSSCGVNGSNTPKLMFCVVEMEHELKTVAVFCNDKLFEFCAKEDIGRSAKSKMGYFIKDHIFDCVQVCCKTEKMQWFDLKNAT